MNIFGINDEEGAVAKNLVEVTFSASPKTLRVLAKFIEYCASEFESGEAVEHYHLQDYWKEWCEDFPDVVVFFEDGAPQ